MADTIKPDTTRHCDPETIAVLALGETPAASDAVHLVTCEDCRAEYDALRATVNVGRSLTRADALVPPPPQVWRAVTDEIQREATVVPLRRTGWSRIAPLLSIAAVSGLVIGGIGGVLISRGGEPAPTVVAAAELAPLPGFTSGGTAQVEQVNGQQVLALDLTDLPQTDGYFEVWLLAEDVSEMIAVGTVGAGERNTFPLPPGVSLERFPVVDVSIEHYDGVVTHSGDSVVRGALST